ncbi:MAG: acyl carrier protein [Coriobacteriia bacterium]|nr:acyl carrier protein [Coriobacteriia bacterium]
MSDSTFTVVRHVLAEGLSVDESVVTPDARLNEDLGADSLDAVEIIMSLEEEFDIEIEPAQAEGMRTVQALVDLVDSLKS